MAQARRLFLLQYGGERVSKALSMCGADPAHPYGKPRVGVLVEAPAFDTGMSQRDQGGAVDRWRRQRDVTRGVPGRRQHRHPGRHLGLGADGPPPARATHARLLSAHDQVVLTAIGHRRGGHR